MELLHCGYADLVCIAIFINYGPERIQTFQSGRDKADIIYYKKLCLQELDWCLNHSEVICNKANTLYKKYISEENFSARNRCLDFPKLERECIRFNSRRITNETA